MVRAMKKSIVNFNRRETAGFFMPGASSNWLACVALTTRDGLIFINKDTHHV